MFMIGTHTSPPQPPHLANLPLPSHLLLSSASLLWHTSRDTRTDSKGSGSRERHVPIRCGAARLRARRPKVRVLNPKPETLNPEPSPKGTSARAHTHVHDNYGGGLKHCGGVRSTFGKVSFFCNGELLGTQARERECVHASAGGGGV